MKIFKILAIGSMLLVTFCVIAGCHRSYYRRQADADALRLIEEKSLDPHWSIPDFKIDIDPASRMFDPFSADHPPMPPDDPSAAEFMQTVDGKPGFPHWHANGDTQYVDNPEWQLMLPADKDGKLIVDFNLAVELALMHSPDYQRQLENLYFSALAVSLERFDFESQFFAPFNSTLTNNGRVRGGGTTLGADNGVGAQMRKAGITGSNLIVGFANSFLWQYSGGDTTVGFGSLSLELIQPLLRRAGRDVILESLTDAERGLLYNVRQLERFRRGYMQQIAAGINSGGGVSVGSGTIASVAGVSQGAGGVLGLLQTQQNIRILEANFASQKSLQQQFDEFHKSQRIDLLQLKQFSNSVFRTQSSLLSAKADYQSSLDNFKISLGLPPNIEVEVKDPILDSFILIDDEITTRQSEVANLKAAASQNFEALTLIFLVQFLINEEAKQAIIDAGEKPEDDLSWDQDVPYDATLRKLIDALSEENKRKLGALSENLPYDATLKELLERIRASIEMVKPIYKKVVEIDFPQTEKDIQRLQGSIERRKRALAELQKKHDELERNQTGIRLIPPDKLDSDPLDTLVPRRNVEFKGGLRISAEPGERNDDKVAGVEETVQAARANLEKLLQDWDLILANEGKLPASELEKEPLKSAIAANPALGEALKTRTGVIKRYISEPGPEVLTTLSNLIIDVSLIQALARVDSLTLPIVDIEWENALEFARANRRDWMNARAQLVDQWRNIEVTADTLESQLDLTFGGDLRNVGDNPGKLRSSNGQIRVGLQFDAPITRLAERNDYRRALIAYQQTRRTFYQFEDRISAQIREIIRQIQVVKLNFEIARIQVKNSVDEVQLASYNLVKPPAPGATSSRVGEQTANNLIRALGNLLTNQNGLIQNWVRFEVLRRQLDFHMGTMQLDENGFWVDPIEITSESTEGRLSGDFIPGLDPMTTDENSNEAPNEGLPPIGSSFRSDRSPEFSANRSRAQSFLRSDLLEADNNRSARPAGASQVNGATSNNRQPNQSQNRFPSSLYTSNFDRDLQIESRNSQQAQRNPQLATDSNSRVDQQALTENRASDFSPQSFSAKRIVERKVKERQFNDFRTTANRESANSKNDDSENGIKIIDRNVNRTSYQSDSPPPRIGPFPFRMNK